MHLFWSSNWRFNYSFRNEWMGRLLKYDYVCESCHMPLFDSDDIIYSRCWKERCFQVEAQQVPRQYLNHPEKLSEFKELSKLKEEEVYF